MNSFKAFLFPIPAAAGLAASLIAASAPANKPANAPKPAQAQKPADKPAMPPAMPPMQRRRIPVSRLYARKIQPFLAQSCVPCHSGASPAANLRLDQYQDKNEATALRDHEIWEKVLTNVRSRSMPPPGFPKPSDEDVDYVVEWINTKLQANIGCEDAVNPGRVTIRRLNRLEYKTTIRDLVGVEFTGVEDFPSDDVGYGFDNIGDVLSLPPILMEKYMDAAEKVVEMGWRKVLTNIPKDPAARPAYAKNKLSVFATRAFRRPVTAPELDRLLKLVEMGEKHGGGYEDGLRLALQGVLVSPNFLFRIEGSPKPGAKAYALNDFELATRLSYFLWSSLPDAELFKVAKAGTLDQPKVLEAQVKRMLKDPKSEGLVENFGEQWLQLRRLKSFKPDPDVFPTFDEKLRGDMMEETSRFFEAIVQEDRSLLELIDADYTFLNERLAKHYGIPGVKGPQFRKVALKDDSRGGVLTHASILTLTSNPTRTSPVKRGKFVMEQFLNEAPPPPPPGTPELEELKAVEAAAPLRVRMEQHREDPKCASCHVRMDVFGFAFENFDGTGKWRTRDGKFPVDTASKLPDGRLVKGPEGVKKVLLDSKEQFTKNMAEKVLTFALGRGLERYDQCTINDISRSLANNNYKFSTLVMEVVKSDPFRLRGGIIENNGGEKKNG